MNSTRTARPPNTKSIDTITGRSCSVWVGVPSDEYEPLDDVDVVP
jgi:hypothetical protein